MSKKRKVENVEGVVWGEAVENEAKKINNFLSSQSEKQIEKIVQSLRALKLSNLENFRALKTSNLAN